MKRIALINDLSGFGKCSLTAAIPVISVLGIQACPLPTAVLSSQTGFDSFYCDDYTNRMNFFTDEWKNMQVSFDGIYSGYLAGPSQIEKVLYFLEQFKSKENIYLADPVMGDNGKHIRIFSKELLAGMKELTLRADVITPNLTELCMLADEDYESLLSHMREDDYTKRIRDICSRLLQKAYQSQNIVVTGIIRRKDGKEYMGNLAVSENNACYVENSYTGQSFSGTGDLFASVLCGCLVNGLDLEKAMKKAVSFLQAAIEEASAENIPVNHGVNFEKYLSRLL